MATYSESDVLLCASGGEYHWDEKHILPKGPSGALISLEILNPRPDLAVSLSPVLDPGAHDPVYHIVLSDGFLAVTRQRADGLPPERVAHERFPAGALLAVGSSSGSSAAGSRPSSAYDNMASNNVSGGGSTMGIHTSTGSADGDKFDAPRRTTSIHSIHEISEPIVVWIGYNGGVVSVGEGPAGTGIPIVAWKDPQPIDSVKFFALTAFDADARLGSIACYENGANGEPMSANSVPHAAGLGSSSGPLTEFGSKPAFGHHRWEDGWRLPKDGCGAIAFEASTEGSVVIGFSEEPRVEPHMYEVVASRNEAAIRREAQAREDAENRQGDAISPGESSAEPEWSAFWVSVDHGVVRLGHGAPPKDPAHTGRAFIAFEDDTPLPVKYFSLTSWSHQVSYRRLRIIDMDPDHGPGSTAHAAAATGAKGKGKSTRITMGAAGGHHNLVVDSQSSRDYLEAKVLPTLTRGIEELLRLVDKRSQDEAQGIEVTSTFHPLNWLAAFVMRNNTSAKK